MLFKLHGLIVFKSTPYLLLCSSTVKKFNYLRYTLREYTLEVCDIHVTATRHGYDTQNCIHLQ